VLFLGIGLALCGLMLDWHRGNVEALSATRTQDAVRLGMLSETLRTLNRQRADMAFDAWRAKVADAHRDLSKATRDASLHDRSCDARQPVRSSNRPTTEPLPEAALDEHFCSLQGLHRSMGDDVPTTPAQLKTARALASGLQVAQLSRAVHERTLADRLLFWYRLLFGLGIPLIIGNKVARARARAAERTG
jgi:hypothetical protein